MQAATLARGRTVRQSKLMFYAKVVEKALQTYERDGWGDFPTQIIPERREIRQALCSRPESTSSCSFCCLPLAPALHFSSLCATSAQAPACMAGGCLQGGPPPCNLYLCRPTADRGPILLCVDTSGSMRGARETVAKALALECMRAAKAQERGCYVFAFAGPQEVGQSCWVLKVTDHAALHRTCHSCRQRGAVRSP